MSKVFHSLRDASASIGLSLYTIKKGYKDGNLKATITGEGLLKRWTIKEHDLVEFKKTWQPKYTTNLEVLAKNGFNPKFMRDCVGMFVSEGNYLSAYEYISLIKIRIKQKKTSWGDELGNITERQLLEKSPKELHDIAQEIRFKGMRNK